MNSKRSQKHISNLFGSLDILITIGTLLIASYLTKRYTSETVTFDSEFVLIIFFVTGIWVILLKATHLARIPRTSAIPVLLSDFVRLTLIGGSIILLLDFIIKIDSFPSIALAIFVLLNFIALFTFRLLTFKVLKKFRANGHNLRNLVIIADDQGEPIIDKILQQREWGYRILHIISDSKYIRDKYANAARVFPRSVNIKSIIRYDIIDELICCICTGADKKLFDLIEFCHNAGITFRIQGKPEQLKAFKTKMQYLDRIPFVTIMNSPDNAFSQLTKMILEIFIAFVILFVLSPVFIIIPFLIALLTEGPVIIKEKRVGLRGRKFYMYKFRTFRLTLNKVTGNDEKELTLLGKILIKTHTDKIPQLFNVIRGEMAVIGPRAPLQSEVDKYEEWQYKRLSVKPGIIYSWEYLPLTDKQDSLSEKTMQDIYYIENWSLKSDIELFFKTFKTVLFARGT